MYRGVCIQRSQNCSSKYMSTSCSQGFSTSAGPSQQQTGSVLSLVATPAILHARATACTAGSGVTCALLLCCCFCSCCCSAFTRRLATAAAPAGPAGRRPQRSRQPAGGPPPPLGAAAGRTEQHMPVARASAAVHSPAERTQQRSPPHHQQHASLHTDTRSTNSTGRKLAATALACRSLTSL